MILIWLFLEISYLRPLPSSAMFSYFLCILPIFDFIFYFKYFSISNIFNISPSILLSSTSARYIITPSILSSRKIFICFIISSNTHKFFISFSILSNLWMTWCSLYVFLFYILLNRYILLIYSKILLLFCFFVSRKLYCNFS